MVRLGLLETVDVTLKFLGVILRSTILLVNDMAFGLSVAFGGNDTSADLATSLCIRDILLCCITLLTSIFEISSKKMVQVQNTQSTL
jgi:hypothetical protein